MKIQYVFEKQEALETLKVFMEELENDDTTQHRRDQEAYEAWKKNSSALITLLSSMDDDIMQEFRRYDNTKNMWSTLKEKFGGTSQTKLRSLIVSLFSIAVTVVIVV